MTQVALALFWGLMVLGLLSRRPFLVHAFFICGAFGSFAAIPPAFSGGVTLGAQSICAIFLLGWMARQRGMIEEFAAALMDPRKIGLYAAFTVFAALSAWPLARLFAGQVEVVPLRAEGAGLHLLRPSTQNITQTLYIALSCLTCAGLYCLWRRGFRRDILAALTSGGVALIVTGFADILTQGTAILAPLRTASYVLHVDVDVLGAKRVVGLMPEASSFGGQCVTMAGALFFLRPLIRSSRALVAATVVVAGLAAFACLSASSTAYVMLALFVGASLVNGAIAVAANGARMRVSMLTTNALLLYLCAVLGAGLLIFAPAALSPIVELTRELVLNKTQSDSFSERSMWNQVALDALVQTHGLGVGIGSARTSSWAVSVLSGAGFFGAFLMGAFVLQTIFRALPPDSAEASAMRGAKFALLIGLAALAISGTTADIGLTNAALVAVIVAMSRAWAPERRRLSGFDRAPASDLQRESRQL